MRAVLKPPHLVYYAAKPPVLCGDLVVHDAALLVIQHADVAGVADGERCHSPQTNGDQSADGDCCVNSNHHCDGALTQAAVKENRWKAGELATLYQLWTNEIILI